MKQFKIPLLLSIVLFFAFASCKVTLLPAYNADLVADIGNFQDDINSVYTVMLASPDKTFSTYSPDYQKVKSEADAIVVKEQGRTHANNVIKQAQLAQTFIYRYADEHKAKGSLTNWEIQTYKDYMKSIIKPLLVSELSMK